MVSDGNLPEIGERIVKPKKGTPISYIELWRGAPNNEVRAGQWKGGFSGRPGLAEALWPAIQASYRGKSSKTLRQYLFNLRTFWRFLDVYEAWSDTTVQLPQCNELLGSLWRHPPSKDAWTPVRRVILSNVGAILRLSHRIAGTEKTFFWPVLPKEPVDGKDIADQVQAKAALNLLKREAQAIYARWKRADQLASQGRNLLVCTRNDSNQLGFRPTEADFHATYRAFILSSGDPSPTAETLYAALGVKDGKRPTFWKARFTDLQAGLYPTMDDLCCLSQLFMARTGWNASTTYSLDINNSNWAVRLPGDLDLYRIESWKDRSHAWQDTVCRGRLTTGPYHIVSALLGRTAPLRALIRFDMGRVSGALVQDALRSPWLAVGTKRVSGRVLSLKADASDGSPHRWWRTKIEQHNRFAAEWNCLVDIESSHGLAAQKNQSKSLAPALQHRKVQIPKNMTPSDWRDIYAGFVFVDSSYSWLLTQWALGHKRLASTRHYLRNRLWRRFSEGKLLEAQVEIFAHLEAGELDHAVLRCKLDLGVEPTAEDRKRLEAFRDRLKRQEITPSGYHCGLPLNPPPEMDPGNPSDGTMRARCGARCPCCPIGLAVDPDYMTKTLVALRLKRRDMSVAAWDESQYPAEIEMLEYDLQQWSEEHIAGRIAHWEAEFAAGRERPIECAGLN